jgi:hypothetical protein
MGKMWEEAAGRRIEVFVEKVVITGGPPLLSLNLLPRRRVLLINILIHRSISLHIFV